MLEVQGVENFEQEPLVCFKSIILAASWRIERPEVGRGRPGGGGNKA